MGLLSFGLFGVALGLAPRHRAVANAPQTSNSNRRARTVLSPRRPRRGDASIKASAAVGVFPCRPGQDFADTSVPVTSTTSPSRMGFAIPKKRATTSELLWASIAA
jgi:hypothetical protein